MRSTLLCLALCTCLSMTGPTSAQATPPAAACKSTVSGDLHLHPLQSAIFGNERTIRVLLPPGYDDAGQRGAPLSGAVHARRPERVRRLPERRQPP